jgi:hypothetical protein
MGLVLAVLIVSFVFAFGDTGKDGTCADTKGKAWIAVIRNGRVTNTNIQARLCDNLTIRNQDHETREIAFGAHDDHVPYDGVAEKFLNQNQDFTITFNKTGTYHWHDHEHDEVGGYFTVSK